MTGKRKIVRQLNECCSSAKETICPPQNLPCLSLCDCCVFPLQSVLQQLVGQIVILGTIADAPNVPPLLFLFKIVEVNDFLVTVTNGRQLML
ncbi:hypothetical protein ABE61_21245 [Lysinibacillus sphaericus]|nr:hypothetical protein [Lysinibacillus sphaericus]MBG9476541.1 hypothetical protein [Lysinibacillus sphaericus]MBG9594595.1 hypothetical protein [Lysinibacillus sphaericus]